MSLKTHLTPTTSQYPALNEGKNTHFFFFFLRSGKKYWNHFKGQRVKTDKMSVYSIPFVFIYKYANIHSIYLAYHSFDYLL